VGKMRFSLQTLQQTYGLKPRRTVQSVTGDFILTSCLMALTFLFYICFSRNRTNRRFSTDLENLKHLEYLKSLYNPYEF
jgi:hypothetical protein